MVLQVQYLGCCSLEIFSARTLSTYSRHLAQSYLFPPLSRGRISSIGIILCGSIYYTWVKHVESQQVASSPTKAGYDRIPLEDVEAGKTVVGPNGKPSPE